MVLSATPRGFTLLRKSGEIGRPDRQFMKALNRALPVGTWWRDEVLAGRAEYPPYPCQDPPRACSCRGDRERLYPAYYVSDARGFPVCADCGAFLDMRDRQQFAAEHDTPPRPPESTPPAEQEEAVTSSPSAIAFMALAERGIILHESKLEAEDTPTILRQIARFMGATATRNRKRLVV